MGVDWSQVAPEVAAALAEGRAVVALESTLIAHGLPWPRNLEAARAAEAEVRRAGGVPATIAVLAGVIRVGLDDVELEAIARSAQGSESEAGRFLKASRRDLAAAVAQGATPRRLSRQPSGSHGARHRRAGHRRPGRGPPRARRPASTSRPTSTSWPVATACSWSARGSSRSSTCRRRSRRWRRAASRSSATRPTSCRRSPPASSGLPLELRADTPAEAAAIVRAQRALGLPGAVVLAQPVAAADALDRDTMEAALAAALAEADARGILGKAVTPFLLDRIRSATAGRSLHANLALIAANARLAAEVAVELGKR